MKTLAKLVSAVLHPLCMPLLTLAGAVASEEDSLDAALAEARELISGFVSSDIGDLGNRLRSDE